MKSQALLVSLAMWATAGVANGADAPKPPVNAETEAKFVAVTNWVREEMLEGGRYGGVDEENRSKIEAKFAEMDALLKANDGAVVNMNDDEKMRMFNDQELVNSILTENDDERLICRNEMPTGSKIPVRTCRTVGELRRWKRHGDDFMRYNERLHQRRGQGGNG